MISQKDPIMDDEFEEIEEEDGE